MGQVSPAGTRRSPYPNPPDIFATTGYSPCPQTGYCQKPVNSIGHCTWAIAMGQAPAREISFCVMPNTQCPMPKNSNDGPLSSDDGPLSSDDGPLNSDDRPLSSNDRPLSSNDRPLSSNDGPLSSNDGVSLGQGISLGSKYRDRRDACPTSSPKVQG